MEKVFEFYSQTLRTGLFSGFLTLSGFLFSMNTFIILNMKKELYDLPGYRERIERGRVLNGDKSVSFYGPLRRLGRLMLWSVVLSVLAAISQYTIGLIRSDYAAIVCMGLAFVAVFCLALVLVQIGSNLHSLFDFLEEQAEKASKDEKDAAPKPAPEKKAS